MRFTLATVLIAMSATLAKAEFQFDLYSDAGCGGNLIASFTGSADGPDDGPDSGSSYEYTGHLGSVKAVKLDQWTTQINTNNDCIATSLTCCQYAPTCTQGDNLVEGGCLDVNEDITGVGSSFTVCDSLCIDNGYKMKRASSVFMVRGM
jgi:hypothetical protein